MVGRSVCDYARKTFTHVAWDEEVNRTMLVHIPKVAKPETLGQMRLISLCNVMYKIITKVIVNRLKPFLLGLVSPT